MSPAAVIKRRGNFLEVTRDGQASLPRELLDHFERYMTYTRLVRTYGAQVYYCGPGERVTVQAIKERLYEETADGRLICLRGFLPYLTNELRKRGFALTYIDCNAESKSRPHTLRYQENWDAVCERFQFRYQQDVCLAAISAHDFGIVEAPPAFGKMWIIAMVCNLYPRARIDIVTTRKDVANSIYQLLLRSLSAVGRVGGGHRRRERVTVYIVNSLDHSHYDADIVLADEVHELCTDDRMQRLLRYNDARMFGFTATKETRLDNTWRRLEGLFGPTIFKIDYAQAEAAGLVAPITVVWEDVRMAENPGEGLHDLVSLKRAAIWRNAERNRVLAEAARRYWREGLQVLVLVDTVDHALHLREHLPEFVLCYAEGNLHDPEERAFYERRGLWKPTDTVMTASLRERLRQQFEERSLMGVIATGVWAVGVSFAGLNVLVRGDGGSSETTNIQTPGRVCRLDPTTGKYQGILVDCLDWFDRRLLARSYARRRAYHRQGWTQYDSQGNLWQPNR